MIIHNQPDLLGLFTPIDIRNKEKSVDYYCRQFLKRSIQMFRYPVIPESIPKRDLEMLLQTAGFAIFTRVSVKKNEQSKVDIEKGTPYVFYGGLGGELNEYYNPTKATVANPFLNFNAELRDGENCVIVYNDSLHQGLMPIFRRYATQLAENDITILLTDINTRIVALLQADNDTAKKEADEYIKKIEKGELSIAGSQKFVEGIREGIKSIPYTTSGSSNQLTQLIELEQYLKAGVFNDIGLNANYNMKRESINASEAQMGTDALLPLTDDMLFNRRQGFKRVKDVLNIDIECEFGSAWEDRHDIADALADDEPTIDESGEQIDESDEQTNEIIETKGETENVKTD